MSDVTPLSKGPAVDIQSLRTACDQLPRFEFKFHLTNMLNTLETIKDPLLQKEIEIKLGHLIKELHTSLNQYNDYLQGNIKTPPDFKNVITHYQALCALNKHTSFPSRLKYALLKVGSVILALICAPLGAVFGGLAGLLRAPALAHKSKSVGTFFAEIRNGLVMGLSLGGLIGYRIPMKLSNAVRRKLKLSLDAIHETIIDLESHPDVIKKELDDLKEVIKSVYFENNDIAYQQFLAKDDVEYELCTVKATFVSEHLEDFLGHHAFIKLTCKNANGEPIFYRNDQETADKGRSIPLTLEYNTTPTDLTRTPSQRIIRKTSGEQIIDMIVMDKLLTSKHARKTTLFNLASGELDMKPGVRDCFTHIDKVLAAANQNIADIYRSDGSENMVGRFIGRVIRSLSIYDVPHKDDSITPSTAKL